MKEREGWASIWNKDPLKVRELNDRQMMTERAFTDREGLSRKSWYKHLVCLSQPTYESLIDFGIVSKSST